MSASKLEKIAKIEAEMEQMKQRKAKLLQEHNAQERKARTHRLCKRAGLIEKLLPELADMDDTEFETFVNKTLLTTFTDKVIREILSSRQKDNLSPDGDAIPAQESETTEHIQPEVSALPTAPPASKPAQTTAAPPRTGGSNSSTSGKR